MNEKQCRDIEQALAGIGDGASIMVSGFGGAGVPIQLLRALNSIDARDLELVVNSARHIHQYAPSLFEQSRVTKVICSAARGRSKEPESYEKQWTAGTLEIEMVPQGTFAERIRAGGAGIPAFYTPTGAGTLLTQGRETREFNGRTHVLEHAIQSDFALIGAHAADRFGNLMFRGTQNNFAAAMATAAKVAVAQVRELTAQPLTAREIDIPGIYIQRVIALGEADH